jgi:hypothetical protein
MRIMVDNHVLHQRVDSFNLEGPLGYFLCPNYNYILSRKIEDVMKKLW